MAEWLTVPVLGSFIVRVDTSRPGDLSTSWRVVCAQVDQRLGDARQRARNDVHSRVGIAPFRPINGRVGGQQLLAARTAHVAQVREDLAAEEQAATHEWRYYAPQAIQARVERAAAVATLRCACDVALDQGVGALPRWRALLQQAGRSASQDAWRSEIQAALQRLRGDFPPHHEQPDPDELHRMLEDAAYREVCP